MSTCKLCKNEVEKLELSHIIPKFIFNDLKQTSITGKMRESKQVNKRIQDGLK